LDLSSDRASDPGKEKPGSHMEHWNMKQVLPPYDFWILMWRDSLKVSKRQIDIFHRFMVLTRQSSAKEKKPDTNTNPVLPSGPRPRLFILKIDSIF
jgi:hypothetical protein